jgi:hypothetical protein
MVVKIILERIRDLSTKPYLRGAGRTESTKAQFGKGTQLLKSWKGQCIRVRGLTMKRSHWRSSFRFLNGRKATFVIICKGQSRC